MAQKREKPSKPTLKKTPKTILLPTWQKNYVLGVDDCICTLKETPGKKSSYSPTSKQVKEAIEVKGAKLWVNKQYDEGNVICFLTTRKEKLRAATEFWLAEHGFKYHFLVMGKPVAEQYHYIDDRHVQATTFRGKFAPFVKEEHTIEVFS